jgi:hypothetical protein
VGADADIAHSFNCRGHGRYPSWKCEFAGDFDGLRRGKQEAEEDEPRNRTAILPETGRDCKQIDRKRARLYDLYRKKKKRPIRVNPYKKQVLSMVAFLVSEQSHLGLPV